MAEGYRSDSNRYPLKHLLNSKDVYDILSIIHQSENGSYATEIAEEFDTNRSYISELISAMERENLVKKGKRDKAQYYVKDIEGMYQIWTEKIVENSEDLKQGLENLPKRKPPSEEERDLEDETIIDKFKETVEEEKNIEEIESETGLIASFFKRYLRDHLDFFIERTIYDLFFNDLANAIGDGQRELRQINQSDKDIETGLNEKLDLEKDESIDPERPVSENMLILTKIMKLVAPDSIRFHGAELYVMEYLEMDEPADRLPHS